MAISIPEELQSFVPRSVANGRFQSEEEAVQEGLQLLQHREEKLEALRTDLQVGIDELHAGQGETSRGHTSIHRWWRLGNLPIMLGEWGLASGAGLVSHSNADKTGGSLAGMTQKSHETETRARPNSKSIQNAQGN